MHPQLWVRAVSSHRWTFDEDVAFWDASGIDHVGLSLRKLEVAGIDDACTRIADAGLRVSNVGEVGWWDLTDAGTWPRQQGRLVAAVDVATRLGGCLVLTTGPALGLEWDDAVAARSSPRAPCGWTCRSARRFGTASSSPARAVDYVDGVLYGSR